MKRFICLVVLVCMTFASVGIFSRADEQINELALPSNWALDEVQKAADADITDNITLDYQDAINRDGFCRLIYNFVTNVVKAPIPKYENNFTDTSSPEVNVLHDLGIILGKAQGIFAPNDFLTREEAATIIIRTVNVLMPVPVTERYFTYDDEEDISEWAMDSVQIISNMGVMEGRGDNQFCPMGTLSAEEAVVILARVKDVFDANYSSVDKVGFTDSLNSQMPSDKNYMYSPLSIKMALALAVNGADGETKEEILKAIGISDIDVFNETSKDIISRYSQTDNLKLSIANSIWINSDKTPQKFSSSYEDKMKEFYSADVRTVSDANAVKEINSWVSDKTGGKIPSIIDEADFWASLINAIYFKAAWENEFSDSATQKDIFTSANGTTGDIDFMNKTSWKNAYISDNLSALELPYKNRFDKVSETGEYQGSEIYNDLDVSMYLIMSDNDISPECELNRLISDSLFSRTYTRLSMPKFKIEFETGLNDILKNIGINTAFDANKARFQKMFDSGNMWITNTIHKTYISVDEKGTEAAAVTAISMATSALPPEPTELKFNKPFYFVIRDNTSGESLFVGRYAFAD